jgi:hypothetical protein
VVEGEAMDSGDKSCNKAMSAAQKYVFFQVFCIATEDGDKDTESHTHTPVPKPAANPRTKSETKPPAECLGFAALCAEIKETKHINHLRNWWKKHLTEIETLDSGQQKKLESLGNERKKVFVVEQKDKPAEPNGSQEEDPTLDNLDKVNNERLDIEIAFGELLNDFFGKTGKARSSFIKQFGLTDNIGDLTDKRLTEAFRALTNLVDTQPKKENQ